MKSLQDQIEWPKPGRYIVAVSGGVDSVVLLNLLASKDYDLITAHFNHGWEGDDDYEQTVRKIVPQYQLPLKVGKGKTRSEADARAARYYFLEGVKDEEKAAGIITAHHRDDLEETVALNLERGTGRRGLSPFVNSDVIRPLVNVRKRDLVNFAKERDLTWIHDSYNDDLKFTRNQIRHQILPELGELELEDSLSLNQQIDDQLRELFEVHGHEATAKKVAYLDLSVLTELIVMMAITVRPGVELDRRSLESLAIDLKTGRLNRPRTLTKELSASYVRGKLRIVFTP
jgi:tRNA(Ile)-lysidine synthetase-like protein